MTAQANISLADQFALVHAELEALEAKKEILRKAILATGKERIDGDNCYVMVSLAETRKIDTKMLRKEFSAEQLALAAKSFDADKVIEIAGDKAAQLVATSVRSSVLLRHNEEGR